MTPANTAENLPPEAQIALAHTPPAMRNALRIYLELDLRLARIVAATSEPMLGQMRLAWWRDMLGKPLAERPSGDAVLDGISEHWAGQEALLVALVDGWEHMLDETLSEESALAFAKGRGAAFSGLGGTECESPATRWALVDAATHISEGAERDMLCALAGNIETSPRLPKSLRGLAVLDALSRRSLKHGGRPLMEGRGASIVAIRAAIFGR